MILFDFYSIWTLFFDELVGYRALTEANNEIEQHTEEHIEQSEEQMTKTPSTKTDRCIRRIRRM